MSTIIEDLCDDAWHQLYFATRKLENAKCSLREAGVDLGNPVFEIIDGAQKSISEAGRKVVNLCWGKKEDKE